MDGMVPDSWLRPTFLKRLVNIQVLRIGRVVSQMVQSSEEIDFGGDCSCEHVDRELPSKNNKSESVLLVMVGVWFLQIIEIRQKANFSGNCPTKQIGFKFSAK